MRESDVFQHLCDALVAAPLEQWTGQTMVIHMYMYMYRYKYGY